MVSLRDMMRELIIRRSVVAAQPKELRALGVGTTRIPFVGHQPAQATLTPVVLVHGYRSSETPWIPLVRRLHAAGVVNVFTLRYNSLSAGVPELAAGLADHVLTVLNRGHWPDAHLVGHSLGGLVARYAVQQLGLDQVTRSVITVATPHHGSPLALFGRGPAAAQLRPRSALLRALPPLEATQQVSWAVIHASADLVVPPPSLPGALCLAGYGHHNILSSLELADAVVAHLRRTEPKPARAA